MHVHTDTRSLQQSSMRYKSLLGIRSDTFYNTGTVRLNAVATQAISVLGNDIALILISFYNTRDFCAFMKHTRHELIRRQVLRPRDWNAPVHLSRGGGGKVVQVREKELRLVALGGRDSFSGLVSLRCHVTGFGLIKCEVSLDCISGFYWVFLTCFYDVFTGLVGSTYFLSLSSMSFPELTLPWFPGLAFWHVFQVWRNRVFQVGF